MVSDFWFCHLFNSLFISLKDNGLSKLEKSRLNSLYSIFQTLIFQYSFQCRYITQFSELNLSSIDSSCDSEITQYFTSNFSLKSHNSSYFISKIFVYPSLNSIPSTILSSTIFL